MQLQQMWKKEYLENRYCQHLTLPELYQRIKDVTKLTCTITPEGKIGAAPVDGPFGFAWRARVHLLVELSLRGIDWREPSVAAAVRGITVPSTRMPKIAAAIAGLRESARTGRLVKYGKVSHLQQSLLEGSFRLSPASAYADAELNDAVRDTELEIGVHLNGAAATCTHFDSVTGESTPLQLVGPVKLTFALPSDYHILCFGSSVSPRMFEDFEADACLIVHDAAEFTKRIRAASVEQLPGSQLSVGAVTYVDPLVPRMNGRPSVYFDKHFRYAYQEELRYVWAPWTPVETLAPMFLNIGPIRDIAELVTI